MPNNETPKSRDFYIFSAHDGSCHQFQGPFDKQSGLAFGNPRFEMDGLREVSPSERCCIDLMQRFQPGLDWSPRQS